MEQQRPTQTVEDYLQLIYIMEREGEEVIAARIKERKGVSAPTVWATLKRMQRDGQVSLGRGHRIQLTPAGQELAESIIRRHMLAERLLTDILKLDWADVHEEAHRMEHAISPLIERQILRLLNNPTTCPHGNLIPGTGEVASAKTTTLRRTHEGDSVIINNIAEHAEDDAALMHYLERNRLIPGARILIDEVSVANATIKVTREGDGVQVVVGLPTADLIRVRNDEESSLGAVAQWRTR
jgi:DtxR family Mn-dependent transcriptional regulator